MPRNLYIYMPRNQHGTILGWYTVKRDCLDWCRLNVPEKHLRSYDVVRAKDGATDCEKLGVVFDLLQQGD